MQINHHLLKYALICIHFQNKNMNTVKPGSKFLTLKVCTEGIWVSLYTVNKQLLSNYWDLGIK